MKVAIVGGGWSGMAAAVEALRPGHQVTVFEAARTLGGRARALPATMPSGEEVTLDNGQHILIGAYRETLRLMCEVGIQPDTALLRMPLTLRFPDGHGLRLPQLPAPLDALAGIALARGWPLRERLGLLREALRWQRAGFVCADELSVSELCQPLGACVMRELIEPLCVSALNIPVDQASARVFLRVLHDALLGLPGGSHLLLPRTDLGTLFPVAAADWLTRRAGCVRLGTRVMRLAPANSGWQLDGQNFDAVLLATPAQETVRLLQDLPPSPAVQDWRARARVLRFTSITTVYAWAARAALPLPMLALREGAEAPAQFVFDRGQLGGPRGLLAFVVSASTDEREPLQARVLQQAREQLGLDLQAVQTVVEKRATFACSPGLRRPAALIAPRLLACGDYVDGPYPATLEGAVRSGLAAAQALGPAQASSTIDATTAPGA